MSAHGILDNGRPIALRKTTGTARLAQRGIIDLGYAGLDVSDPGGKRILFRLGIVTRLLSTVNHADLMRTCYDEVLPAAASAGTFRFGSLYLDHEKIGQGCLDNRIK